MSPSDPAPDLDVNANDAVAFLVEVGVLALLAVAGFTADAPVVVRVLLGVGLPVVAGLLWGLFAAPRARVRSAPLRLATKVLVLGAGVLAGYLVMPVVYASVLLLVVAVNLALMYVGPMARRGSPLS